MGAECPVVLQKLSTGNYSFFGGIFVSDIQNGEFLVHPSRRTLRTGKRNTVLKESLSMEDEEWLIGLADRVRFDTEEMVLI